MDICPYYYKDKKKNGVVFSFEYCHKPKEDNKCPEGRESNECKVHRFEAEWTEEAKRWILGE